MKHVLCFFFPQVVDKQNGDAVLVRQPFQNGQVPVVVGVGGIVDGPDYL